MQDGKNYIDGVFVESASDSVFDNGDPCSEETLGIFPNSIPLEIDNAYVAARDAFESWNSIGRVQRAEYLYEVAKLIEERREELATVISLETGKNYNESIAEVNEALHMAQYAFGSGLNPQG